MGACAASKLAGAGDVAGDPVTLCRKRKQLLKSAIERRSALAVAHANYIQSLNAFAAAIDLFVARHTAATAVLTILPAGDYSGDTSPAASPDATLPCNSRSELKAPPLAFHNSVRSSSPSDSSSGDDRAPESEETGEIQSGYFVAETAADATKLAFGWDFFNVYDDVKMNSDEELRMVRKIEGIPEHEEIEDEILRQELLENPVKVAPLSTEVNWEIDGAVVPMVEFEDRAVGNAIEEKALMVAEMSGSGREMLQALRDVEDEFIKAFESGEEVSKMLEVTRFQIHSGNEDVKENSSKTIHAITWHRSPSSVSSSSKSQFASSCVSTSWTESNSDLFDDYGGMTSGSHSQTLGRLYAWEKKLYEEVKAGDQTRQLYEKKRMQLQNQEAKGADSRSVAKTRSAVRDLYTRIWVALRAVESISQRIQKLRDEELHPQIIELLQGLMRSWKIMLESHETQKQIMFEVNTFTCPLYRKFCDESQRLATNLLVTEIRNWRTCFVGYISAQRAYVETLDGWLSKFLLPDVEYYTQTRSSLPSIKAGTPLLVDICHQWFVSLSKLPDKPVSIGMRNFTRTVRFLWVKQGEEIQQKRKVDSLAKELDHRIIALQKAENKVLEPKLEENKTEMDARERVEHLSGNKELLDTLRKKLDIQKSKHHDCIQETHDITLNGFKIGLASIFESLTDFSKDSLKLYSELLAHSNNPMLTDKGSDKSSYI